jgi:ADP-dependent NAD(P)H-hydrate dehydratase / NAD(P)H-hydrate epimerase
MRALTATQMREVDVRASERYGEVALMRRAGEAIAQIVRSTAPDAHRIVAFAGPGNNGGDAFDALAELDPLCDRVVYVQQSPRPSVARVDAESRARAAGVTVRALPAEAADARAALADADLVLDGLLGTGARPDPSPSLVAAIDAMNASRAPVLAIDIPTGVDATSGATASSVVRARVTVTLGALKTGLLLDPARAYVGALWLADIGIRADEIEAAEGERFAALDDREFLRLLPVRGSVVDKRGAGAPLIVGGSSQFPGAAVLCARGAARSGAGYVTVATASQAAPLLRAHLVEQVVMTYEESDVDGSIGELLDLMNHSSAVGLGPGLGLSDETGEIVRGFVRGLTAPFVADASALFHFARHLDVLRGKPCVVTPHEREFARLSGEGTIAPGTRVQRLRAFVARTGITTLLKGRATLVDDGATTHINVTGSPALATAGTGDVLTGIISTLLAQGLAPVDAARLGAYWHGLAGQQAASERTVGVVAGDVADALGRAIGAARVRGAERGDDSTLVRIC